MVEVPSLLFQLDALIARVDFLSVGSNDLVQFLFAADRGNRRVADRFDPLSPPVLRALMQIVDKAKAGGKPVALCGELASKPIGALALIGLGFRAHVADAVGARRRSRRCCSISMPARPRRCCGPLVENPPADGTIREKLEAFAAAEGLQL